MITGPNLGHILDANTVALYRFDEASGYIVDAAYAGPSPTNPALNLLSLSNHNGTLAAATGLIDGCRDFAFAGSAGSDFQRAGTQFKTLRDSLSGNLSYETWVKPRTATWALSGNAYPFDRNTLFTIYNVGQIPFLTLAIVRADKSLNVIYENGAQGSGTYVQYSSASNAFLLDVWNHLEFIISGTTLTFGVNGVDVGQVTGIAARSGGGPAGATSYVCDIGQQSDAVRWWRDLMDDTRISKVARTPAERLESYYRGMGLYPDPAVVLPTTTRQQVAQEPATDLLLDVVTDGFSRASNGDLVMVRGLAAVRQDIQFSLEIFRGEYAFNTDAGAPWTSGILGKALSDGAIAAVLRSYIETRPHVTRVTRISVDRDVRARVLTVSFDAATDFGALSAAVNL